MKLTTTNGLSILKENGDLLYKLPSILFIKVNPEQDIPESVLISNSTNFSDRNNSILLSVDSISEIDGVSFNGNLSDLIGVFEDYNGNFSLSNDFISIEADEESGDHYETFCNFSDRKEIILVKTTISGTHIKKLYYTENVVNGAAYNTLWSNKSSQTYVELIDM